MHIYINIKNGNDRIWSLNTCSINVNGHIRLIIYASHRGKRMTRVRDESQVISPPAPSETLHHNFKYRIDDVRSNGNAKWPARVKKRDMRRRILRNALSRTSSFAEFMTTPPKISVPLLMQIRGRKICADADVRFRAYVYMWGVRLFHLFSSHRPAHQIPTLSAFSVFPHSFLAFLFAFF